MSNQDSIKVLARVRPLLNKEKTSCVQIDATQNKIRILDKNFAFDYVKGTSTKQSDIMDVVGKPIADRVLEGYNATIFAYGQTSSGKTYTMNGNPTNRGLIPNTLNYIFNENNPNLEVLVHISCYQIYNETVNDLFSTKKINLKIRENKKKEFFVENLTKKHAESANHALQLIEIATSNRAVSETKMNEASSRSHCIFSLEITTRQINNNNIINSDPTKQIKQRKSTLNLVDLAGSERQSKAKSNEDRLREAGSINKSLTVLGHVMKALSKPNKSNHVHYRDSKLTMLLKGSLGGNSLTFMIACISPSTCNSSESLSTLQFAKRVKKVRNKPKQNDIMYPSLDDLKEQHSKYADMVEELTRKYQETQQENNQLNQNNIALNEELTNLKLENKEKTQKIEELESKLNAQKKEMEMKYEEKEYEESENQINDDIDDYHAYYDSRMKHISQLTNDELYDLYHDENLYEEEWKEIRREIQRRLLRNPPIGGRRKKDVIVEIWDRIKEKKKKQFIDAMFTNDIYKKLNPKELMQLISYTMNKKRMNKLKEQQQCKKDRIITRKMNGKRLFRSHYEEYGILSGIKVNIAQNQLERMCEKEMKSEIDKKLRQNNGKKTYNPYAS